MYYINNGDQARNHLGTLGWEKFSEKGPNFLSYVQ